MPIKDVAGVIVQTPPNQGRRAFMTDVHESTAFAVCDDQDALKQIRLDPSLLNTNSTLIIQAPPGSGGTIQIGGGVTFSAFGSTPNADGASVSGSTVTLQPADGTHPGGVSITAQTLAGNKTFSGQVILSETLTVDAGSTFLQSISITNAAIDGTPGMASQITTGDPNTVGLIIQGSSFNSGGFGPAAPTSFTNLTSGATYAAGLFTGTATSGWGSGGNSTESFTGNGYTEFSLPLNQYVFGGLNSIAMVDSGSTYTYTGFAISVQGGAVSIYNEGVLIADAVSTQMSDADIFRVERSGTSIVYKQNGSIIYTQTSIVSGGTVLFGAYATDPAGGSYTINGIDIEYGAVTDQTANLLQFNSDTGTQIAAVDSNGNAIVQSVQNTANQTTLTATGTATCSMPEQGSSYKLAIISFAAYTDTGTQTYTFPTPFTVAPQLWGDATAIAGATVTTTTATFSVTSDTGILFIGGL